MIGLARPSRVLDAGCGTGRNLVKLLRKSVRVDGLDLSPGMIAEAKETLKQLSLETNLLVGDLSCLPMRDSCYDAVINSAVLDHVRDIRPVMHEFGRVLRRGGTLIVSDTHPEADLVLHRAKFRKGGIQYSIEEYPHPFEEIYTFAREAGMERISAVEMGLSDQHRKFYDEETFRQERDRNVYMILWFAKR